MPLTREELKERLVTLHEVSLELVSNISIDSLLERIVSLACEQSGAKYGALGVLDDSGRLKQFITHGLSLDEIKRISHPPVGLGLIGELMHGDSKSIRIPEIAKDSRSHGFPSGHPEMHSMLGVPIRRGERQLGQIYLTEKQNAKAFSSEDQTIIEIFAAYAGVAIENARLYEELQNHDHTLTKRNEELALVNDIGAALSLSLDLDEILNKSGASQR